MKLEEWHKQAEKGTSGDMVYDILSDWKADEDTRDKELRQRIAKSIIALEAKCDGILSRLMACEEEIRKSNQ